MGPGARGAGSGRAGPGRAGAGRAERSGACALASAVLAALALLALLAAAPHAAAAQRPRKSAQDCNDELRDKAAAIAAAGMSASAFFHSCWWDTPPGLPTPIVADERARRPFEARSSEPRPAARRSAGALGRPARIAGRRPPSRRDGERAPPVGRADDEAIAALDAGAAAAPAPSDLAVLPGRVTVGVPALGRLSLPVLPVLAPTVRAVVDHPLVPGLVTADP